MASKLKYRNTKLNYVKGTEKVLFSNGVCISLKEFQQHDAANTLIDELEERAKNSDELFDFDHAVQEGILRKMPMVVPQPVLRRKNAIKQKQPAALVEEVTDIREPEAEKKRLPRKRKPKPVIEEPPEAEVSDIPVVEVPFWKTVPFMVEVVMLVAAVGSAIMSAYHTSAFMLQSGKPGWVSALTGLIMILFSATAFTAARYFFQEKDASRVFGWLFIVLGIGIISFSMFSTIAVNYNQFNWEEQREVAVSVEGSTELSIANETRTTTQAEVKRLDEEIQRVRTEAAYWQQQDWRRHDRLMADIRNLEGRREKAWDAFVAAGQASIVAENKIIEEQGTIYGFLQRLFGVSGDALRFFVYVIPSIFYDVCAPFGFACLLLLEDKRRRRRKDGRIPQD